MKKSFFTMTEMLVVVVVILILAAIGSVVAISALAKAELTNCTANQGQLGKTLLSSMQNNDHKLVSGSTLGGDDLWVTELYRKRLVQSLDEVRCPAMVYTNGNDIDDDDARKEVYGMVTATSGVFNFKSNKLLRDSGKRSISPANMLLGGCTAKDFKNARAVATLGQNDGKLIAIHKGEVVNNFFLDGSVTSLEADAFAGKAFYIPKSDGTMAEKFTGTVLKE